MASKEKTKNIIFQISAILILVAATLFNFLPHIAPYIMVAGVAGYGAVIFTTGYPGKSLRGKRLFNFQILAVVLMAVSNYLMFMNMGEWIYALLAAAILTLYCAIMLPRVYKKEQEEEEKEK